MPLKGRRKSARFFFNFTCLLFCLVTHIREPELKTKQIYSFKSKNLNKKQKEKSEN